MQRRVADVDTVAPNQPDLRATLSAKTLVTLEAECCSNEKVEVHSGQFEMHS